MEPGLANFLLASIVMELTPGPNMTWLALLAAREGRSAGLRAVAGILVGLFSLSIIAATGAGALIASYPVLYQVLRWGGVLFLLYLAVEAWIGGRGWADAGDQSRHFRRGVIVNLLNPKAVAVFLVLIPSFAGGDLAAMGRLAFMTAVYLAIATAAHVLIVLFAAGFNKTLSDPRIETPVRRIFAIALGAIAGWFALTS